MKEIVLSLLAGWVIGIFFSWLKLPLPVPPLPGLVGLAGMLLGGLFLQELRQLFTH
ncbi:XapX domain protein [Nostocales cyanobacterium HT-58-2]|nr:XapX domain protein [Nostocales cyanobacterium HT-58-2]